MNSLHARLIAVAQLLLSQPMDFLAHPHILINEENAVFLQAIHHVYGVLHLPELIQTYSALYNNVTCNAM